MFVFFGFTSSSLTLDVRKKLEIYLHLTSNDRFLYRKRYFQEDCTSRSIFPIHLGIIDIVVKIHHGISS